MDSRITSLFYDRPARFFQYIEQVLSIELPNELRESYAELKATRDLLVHNSGQVNEVYVQKTKQRARGRLGQEIPLGEEYFAGAVHVMKSLVSSLCTQCLRKYGEIVTI